LLLPQFDQFVPQAFAEPFSGLDQGFQRDLWVRPVLEWPDGFEQHSEEPVPEYLAFGR
jgi:hypothetical protein